MRLVVCVLACVGAGAMAVALADPPANPAPPAAAPAPSAAQPAASAPAASATAPVAKAQTPTVDVDAQKEQDQLERHFLAEGYKLEMHNGQKYFCRREEELGSHLGGQKVCGTAQQLKLNEDESQAAFRRGQSQQGNGPTSR